MRNYNEFSGMGRRSGRRPAWPDGERRGRNDFGPGWPAGGGHGGHGGHGGAGRGGQRRARRGNVRAAVLALLTEQPMHGYQMIQELSRRSGGRWNPSPGSIYPTLQLLEDEGLVVSKQSEDGKRLYELTDAGRAEVARTSSGATRKPWEQSGEAAGAPPQDLLIAIRDAAGALFVAAASGSDEQKAQVVSLLAAFRQNLREIVPDSGEAGPFGGRRRGPWGRSGPGWTFGIPDWIFGGMSGQGGPAGPGSTGEDSPPWAQWGRRGTWAASASAADEDPEGEAGVDTDVDDEEEEEDSFDL